jgi:uncharacterized protein (TIGR02453 family)
MMTDAFTGFSPAATKFLTGLARNNARTWFEERREIYEQELRAPLRALVEEMDVRLATTAPEIIGDPKRSPFRIHRDIRFSKDKSPYKTHVSFWLAHRDVGRAGSEIHGGAGLYFHFQPRQSFIAAGIWMPDPPALAKLRAALVDDVPGFKKTLTRLRKSFGPLSQEAILTRTPRGFDDAHPAAEWLRYKSFTVHRPLLAGDLRDGSLPALLMRHYANAVPFVRWLNAALGLRPVTRR